ncbi:MAG: DEAD/DEAH box helicase [Pseudomonadota bacterium]|nr:DEAD/DEAH box helicase [Pseudomonadota bacterium]
MSNKTHLTQLAFEELGLPEPLLEGAKSAGFEYCTAIQAATLPIAMKGVDLAGQAQTGTGKTAAFLLAAMHRLLTRPPSPKRRPNQPRAIILAPTRELAIQIHNDAQALGQHTELRLALVYGGTGYQSQRQQLEEGVDILIGTPGRIIDYFKQRVFDLLAIEVVILDEADRMFDLGFISDVRYLLRRMPAHDRRLNLLFSATLSYRVTELAYEHMNNPELIRIDAEQVTATGVRQAMYHVAMEDKLPLLLALLAEMQQERVIIFVNTKRAAEQVTATLDSNGHKTALLSGDVPQKKRQQLLHAFNQGDVSILVATDVAARGLHIPEVSHVVNFDLPQDAEDYVHRIGRTARAGAEGDAVSFCCEEYCYSLPEIEEYVGEKINVKAVPAELPTPAPAAKSPRSRRGGKPTHPRNRSKQGSKQRSGRQNRASDASDTHN